jgi:Chaperone of endosialidase
MKTTTNIIYSACALFVLACLALLPQALAVCQQGCDLPQSNTFLGDDALLNNTTGAANTAIGDRALVNNIRGSSNTATGVMALESNRTGDGNTANGAQALQTNTTGNDNTAIGLLALIDNTTGSLNTATGSNALRGNTTGFRNMANGADALSFNTTGSRNTADGFGALEFNSTGSNNTATGAFALNGHNVLTTGSNNTADGFGALFSDTTGANNTALGYQAGINLTTGSNNIDIGANVGGGAGDANTIRIGARANGLSIQRTAFIQGISGAMVANGVGVIVGPTGQLGTVQSSKRFKEAIKPMDKTSEAILALKPVIFRYKKELDPEKIPQFGLIAEEVENVNPDLVARDEEGKIMSVRYEAVNAMLLNEFLKEHRKVEKLEAMVAEQHKDFEAAVAELKGQMQKVSAQLELSKAAPKTVLNSR